MVMVQLQPRTMFERSRDAEFFDLAELQKQTGQPCEWFVSVALKELLDNACDICETEDREKGLYRIAPSLTLTIASPTPEQVALTVQDNGHGMPPETVTRILNFATRTSDKAAYRSPTRGAQGNALKTVIGIPCALGVRAPVVIESLGVRHAIRAWIDPAGELHMDYTTETIPQQPGTSVTITVPERAMDGDPARWGKAFALFNPHASVKIRRVCATDSASLPVPIGKNFSHVTIAFPGEWRKYCPGDATSTWWYTVEDLERLIFSHVNASQRGEPDKLLRAFVQEFRNLSSNAVAKAVCATVPMIKRLSDFVSHEEAIATLHAAMRQHGKPPSPATLGTVGEAHFRQCFDAWYGVKRFWYGTSDGMEEGLPFVVEVAVAETLEEGEIWTGVNFSPTFDDPLSQALLSNTKIHAYGLRNFLAETAARPQAEWWDGAAGQPAQCRAVAVHLICPAFTFLDRAKTRLQLPRWMADHVAKALWTATRDLYKEKEAREKDAAKQARAEEARAKAEAADAPPKITQKAAVFTVMQEAWEHVTGNGMYKVSKRFLFYAVRKRIQQYTSEALDPNYFTHTLLPAYEQAHGELPGIYAESLGVFHEPHGGAMIILDDAAVEAYVFPEWRYDKILYIEKRTVWPILEVAQLAERYDMAILTGEGYATEAMRVLFRTASKHHQYQLFVLHDADPDGYNIAVTLREESARMPGYAVEIIDLGLFIEDALALGLDPEDFTRKKALQAGLVLSAEARRAFEGRRVGPKSWISQRVELNALSAPQLVAYIERRLQETGVRGKVIPPDVHLTSTARERYRARVATMVQRTIETLLPIDALTARLQDRFSADAPLHDMRERIERAFATNAAQAWHDVVDSEIRELLHDQWDTIENAVGLGLVEAIEQGALMEPEDPDE
jgi:hypothetical protein